MNSIHSNFNILLDLPAYLGKKILFISEITPDRSKFYNWIPIKGLKQLVYQGLKAVDMAWTIVKTKEPYDIIIIFEHKPWYSILLYLVCAIKRKPTFFIVHGFQQTYKLSTSRTLGFKLLLFFEKRFKFYPIHLEKTDHDYDDCLKFYKSGIYMLTPLPEDSNERLAKPADSVLKIGIVGMIRPDKPIMPIIKILENYSSNDAEVETHIGTPFWQLPDELKKMAINLTDTTSSEQYNSFIKSLDIVINYYEKEHFYHRSSGVLNDAVNGGCFVIVPNYPLFKEQISNPVKVGETYENIEDIKRAIDKAIEYLSNNVVEFEKWRQIRTKEIILKDLSRQMLDVL
ncbi:hypothetical protein HYN56_22285 [Flavobacterium crocinum]|uniref:Glycosyl transferase family 1 domain-containing protein n=1 Tax=Flavobacterium crocinum TaxID=2183896 RepID=A0A2S1YRT5_9FLAO|nr:glycosyltransferase [Flavobacterium crocinum]AWK06810.1 hypothetical protein HYN56_22285 [Flavobacterium crocinum]